MKNTKKETPDFKKMKDIERFKSRPNPLPDPCREKIMKKIKKSKMNKFQKCKKNEQKNQNK